MKNSDQSIETEAENVVLASRLPIEVKEKVEKFAKNTMRTLSQSVHYLLETHPELKEQVVRVEVNK
jgi:predicted DNA-binding protein